MKKEISRMVFEEPANITPHPKSKTATTIYQSTCRIQKTWEASHVLAIPSMTTVASVTNCFFLMLTLSLDASIPLCFHFYSLRPRYLHLLAGPIKCSLLFWHMSNPFSMEPPGSFSNKSNYFPVF
jgi:hypothetical protein